MPDYLPPQPASHGAVIHNTKAAPINYIAAIFAYVPLLCIVHDCD